MSDLTLEEVRELMDEFHGHGYEKRRRQIARSVEKHDRPTATLDDVPERLRTLMDGFNFLQYSRQGLYIYYSKDTIKAAVDNGLVALVADGIHKLPPEELGDNGQLYTIHGICNANIGCPSEEVVDDNQRPRIPSTTSSYEGTSIPPPKFTEKPCGLC
ncbi:hypothetical protein Y032_0012g1902 [Ancylostoma ceylanicum]|nr:hypothetical protein Y032_0012g1902 [Ancylostoma ceylanicum]